MNREQAVDLICALLDAENELLDARTAYVRQEYINGIREHRDEIRHKLVNALCASEDPEVGQCLDVVRKWLHGYEQEEIAFSRYSDHVILDNVMTAGERRALSAAMPKPRTEQLPPRNKRLPND